MIEFLVFVQILITACSTLCDPARVNTKSAGESCTQSGQTVWYDDVVAHGLHGSVIRVYDISWFGATVCRVRMMFSWREFGSRTGRRSGPDPAARSFVTILNIMLLPVYTISTLSICYIVPNLDLIHAFHFTTTCFLLLHISQHIPILVGNTISGLQGDLCHWDPFEQRSTPFLTFILQSTILVAGNRKQMEQLSSSFRYTGRTTYSKDLCGITSPP